MNVEDERKLSVLDGLHGGFEIKSRTFFDDHIEDLAINEAATIFDELEPLGYSDAKITQAAHYCGQQLIDKLYYIELERQAADTATDIVELFESKFGNERPIAVLVRVDREDR